MLTDLETVVSQFDIEGDLIDVIPIKNGHINTTFRIETHSSTGTQIHLLQKINTDVFKNPSHLMKNISAVTQHLDHQLVQRRLSQMERERRALQIVKCIDGHDFLASTAWGDWRMYQFISGTHPVDNCPSLDEIYQAGFGFGEFISQLLDFPVHQLEETIPHFHHGPLRFEAFKKSVALDLAGRSASIQKEIEFIRSHEWLLDAPAQLIRSHSIPIRVTHNDTKSNNVLLDDETNQATCVIDLDTVMPGLVLFDLGDLVRTTCSPAAEDESNLNRIKVELPRIEHAILGFLEGTQGLLSTAEIESLRIGPSYMALIMATRFVTDFLTGDTYFQIEHPKQNLHRGRAQMKLTEELINSQNDIARLLSIRS